MGRAAELCLFRWAPMNRPHLSWSVFVRQRNRRAHPSAARPPTMVLNDLGRRINAAFSDLGRTPTVDDAAVDSLLQSVAGALLESDVNVRYVASLRDRVRNDVKEALNGKGAANQSEGQRKNAVQRAVFNELVRLVDPGGAPAFKPTKGKSGVIMFVGLQGSGKTTSCTKLALWYQKRGFKAGLVCADTFRAGAFDQLKQNAAKARIPFYGSYTETDPVAIAEAGVKSFKKARFDVIIVDTSGRHKQEQELFKEMIQIGEVTKPDQTIMVLDASIGQAAEAQSKAFKQAAGYGAILVTKLDGHAKGGGAISAYVSRCTASHGVLTISTAVLPQQAHPLCLLVLASMCRISNPSALGLL